MAARSGVVVTTVRAARAGRAPSRQAAAASAAIVESLFMATLSERVGAVRPDREQELEQELVGIDALGVARMPVLAAHLAELARPVCQQERPALVTQGGILGAVGPVVAAAGEPAAREL